MIIKRSGVGSGSPGFKAWFLYKCMFGWGGLHNGAMRAMGVE